MLPWLVNNFNITPVLLVRHPCAVVSSQLKRGFYFKKDFIARLFKGKYKDIYIKYKSIFEEINTTEEYLAAIWAITNIYPVKHKYNNKKWLTVSYESLLINPGKELARLSSWLDIDIEKDDASVFKPSFTTDDKTSFSKKTQISKWETRLSEKQISVIITTVQKFGVDFYTKDTEPDYNILYK